MGDVTGIRHLWILRHAKAVDERRWGGSDRDRPLTGRGRRDATALGNRLAAEASPLGLRGLGPPGHALCSSAVRTRETVDLVLGAAGVPVAVDAYGSLYQAGTETALRYVRELDDQFGSALLVGHNPTMYALTWDLIDSPHDRAVLDAAGFPTCGLAVIGLRVNAWEEAADGCGTLLALFAPPYSASEPAGHP